jgi:hypothetical protein
MAAHEIPVIWRRAEGELVTPDWRHRWRVVQVLGVERSGDVWAAEGFRITVTGPAPGGGVGTFDVVLTGYGSPPWWWARPAG